MRRATQISHHRGRHELAIKHTLVPVRHHFDQRVLLEAHTTTSSATTRDRHGRLVRSKATDTNRLRTLLSNQLRTFDVALAHDGILVDIRDDDAGAAAAPAGETGSLDVDGEQVEVSLVRSVNGEDGRWDWELQFQLPSAAGLYGNPARVLLVAIRGRRVEIPHSLRREGLEAYWSGRESLLDHSA